METAMCDQKWQVCERQVITVVGQQGLKQLFGIQRAGVGRGVGGKFELNPRIKYEFSK